MNTKLLRSLFLCGILSATLYTNLRGQSSTRDSLRALIKTNKQDTTLVNNLNHLASTYRVSVLDSILYFSNAAIHLAQQLNFKAGIAQAYLNKRYFYYRTHNFSEAYSCDSIAIKLYTELGDKTGMMVSHYDMGFLQSELNNWQSALDHYSTAVNIAQELNNKDVLSRLYNNISEVHLSLSKYPEALDYLLKSLKLKEELGDKKAIATAYLNISTIYQTLNKNDEAIIYLTKSIQIRKEIGEAVGVAIGTNNLGNIYQTQNKLSEALICHKEALAIASAKSTNQPRLISEAAYNISSIYILQHNYSEAINYLTLSKETFQTLGDKQGVSKVLVQLGNIAIQQNELKAAKNYLTQGISLAKESEDKPTLQSGYEYFIILDSLQGNWQAAFNHHKLAVIYRDSISNEDINNKITEITLTDKFDRETEKIKLENEKQQAIAEAEKRRQTVISWSIGAGLLIVLIATAFILRSLRITSKQKHIIEEQKQIVEEKQKEIVDSIKYAKRIQTALLTSSDYINEHFEAEHFVLFKPKDIVSGDFYWASKSKENLFYMITADCTGHGVPGAMMSMLNISLLNEIVIERGIQLPHEILNMQRKEIIHALNPKGSQEEAKDGMDCILCVFDFSKMLLHFAAANNPLWLIRNSPEGGEFTPSGRPIGLPLGEADRATLVEYKADKMPVGKYDEKSGSFTLQTIELQKGDIIYTSTDGFADQFGTNGKKLTKKKFKEELLKIHHLPMHEQQQHLNQFFENWKGNNEQIDDVCVIGVRI